MREKLKCFFDDCFCGAGGGGVCDGGVCDVGIGGGGGGGGDGGGVSGDGDFVVVLISNGGPAVCSPVNCITSVVAILLV